MQSVSSRIWTRIAVFISHGDNDYTTGTSNIGSRTTVLLLLLLQHAVVLGYYYASNIVLEESMMQVVSVSQQ